MFDGLSLLFCGCFLTLKYLSACLWEIHTIISIIIIEENYYSNSVYTIKLISFQFNFNLPANNQTFVHFHSNCRQFLGVLSNQTAFVRHFDGSLIKFLEYLSMLRMYFGNLLLLHVDSIVFQTIVLRDIQLEAKYIRIFPKLYQSITYHATYGSYITKNLNFELTDNSDAIPINQFLFHLELPSPIAPKTTEMIKQSN